MAKAKKPEEPKKKAEYIHRTDDRELNIRFYERYGENLLFNKSIASKDNQRSRDTTLL